MEVRIMGKVVLIIGESGAGKSASLRNFEPDEIGIFNVSGKPLPFRKKLFTANTSSYTIIKQKLIDNQKNCYCIDDAGLAMTFYLFDHALEGGYGKFTTAAKDFYDLVQCAIRQTSEDTIVFFTMHTDRSDDGTKIKAKVGGKMIDNQLTLESLFSTVLLCQTDGKNHWFVTQSDGVTTCKSPMDMLPLEMDNDLKAVDAAIREYYELAPLGTKPEKKKKTATSVTTADKIGG